MSVAQGEEALDDEGWAPPEPPPVPTTPPDRHPAPVGALPRSHLPPLPPVPSSPADWLRATRAGRLPATLLGGVVGGLVVAREPGARPGPLVLALVGLVLAHALAGLVHALGDARPERAGPLRRAEAGRALLAVGAAGLVVLAVLVVARDPRGLALAAAGALAVLLAVSRRSGARLSALAGLLGGAVATALAVWAATGSLGRAELVVGLVAGGALAGLLAGRRAAVRGATARLLVLAPYAAAGLAVALGALPWTALLVALALPAARRASVAASRADASSAVAGHARLFAVLLVAGLLVAAVLGPALPLT
jgi:1,4-dihydroxy-2-naphthoate polyprenyltransferase